MGEKQEAQETGEDLERKRAWEYTIEDNEKWDKKVARKGRRGDFSFTGQFGSGRRRLWAVWRWCMVLTRRDSHTDYDDIARRKYKKVRGALSYRLSALGVRVPLPPARR